MKGKSYLDGDLDYAQALIDKLSGTGKVKTDKNGRWLNKEAVIHPNVIGTHVDSNGVETKTNKAMIVYSKTGTHIYPRRR